MTKKKLLLICLFTGIFGGHCFAIGKPWKGVVYLFTCGLFFIGWIYDFIMILVDDDTCSYVKATKPVMKPKITPKPAVVNKTPSPKVRITPSQPNNIPCCPKCRSTALAANKRGFSLGKGIVGSMVNLPVGIAAGMIGKNKIEITCLNCGYTFKPGKR